MATANVKTEMKGDTSRWTTREDAKRSANKRRRRLDKTVCRTNIKNEI